MKIRKIRLTLGEITGLRIRMPHTPRSQKSNETTWWERMSCPTAFPPPLSFPTWCKQLPRYERLAWIWTLDCSKPQVHDYRAAGKLESREEADMGSVHNSELRGVSRISPLRHTATIVSLTNIGNLDITLFATRWYRLSLRPSDADAAVDLPSYTNRYTVDVRSSMPRF